MNIQQFLKVSGDLDFVTQQSDSIVTRPFIILGNINHLSNIAIGGNALLQIEPET
jgi:hypothetical protein